MRTFRIAAYAPSAALILAVSGCGGRTGNVSPSIPSRVGPAAGGRSLGAPARAARITPGTYQVLYSFGRTPDGALPGGPLVNVGGTLYGTTYYGGMGDIGTVYTITTSGKESVLYRFAGGSDGAHPESGLSNVGGTLYGTTSHGGSRYGTVYKITTSGTESVLYSFQGGSDGAVPVAGLLNVGGTLYGTTPRGGSFQGTVFKITTSGMESVLYRFRGAHGQFPFAALTNVGGTLYGTTDEGGASFGRLYGTVFKITTSGTESVVYSFTGGSDGAYPAAG